MRRSKGQAAVLVILFLAVGALVTVPVLQYATTGLRSQRIYETTIAKQYNVDSAIEDALWRMLNQGLLSSLDPSNPIYEFQFDPNTSVDIKIPTMPDSGWVKERSYFAKVDVMPNWLQGQPVGEPTFIYIIRISQPHWDLNNYGFDLPGNMHYVLNSARVNPENDPKTAWVAGPEKLPSLDPDAVVSNDGLQYQNHPPPWNSGQPGINLLAYPGTTPDQYLTISTVGGKERLSWTPPPDWRTATGIRVLIQTIQVTGNPGWGIHYIQPWITDGVTLLTGATGAIGVAMYTIVITVEGVDYEVVVAYDSTTETMKIISYQML